MSNATVIDEKVLNGCINKITRSLLQSDVQFKLVRDMQTNIKKIVTLDDLTTVKHRLWVVMSLQSVTVLVHLKKQSPRSETKNCCVFIFESDWRRSTFGFCRVVGKNKIWVPNQNLSVALGEETI